MRQKLEHFREVYVRHSEKAAFHLDSKKKAESLMIQVERQIYELNFQAQSRLGIQFARKPDQLRKIKFAGHRLTNVILDVFSRKLKEMSVDELIHEIYEPANEKEVKACKRTLSTALNRAVRRGLLTRVSEGVYSLPLQRDVEQFSSAG